MTGGDKITVLNPVGYPPKVTQQSPAPRLEALGDKTVYLVDCRFDDNARMPTGEYWDYQLAQNYIYPRATFGEEPWATRLKAPPDELIQMFAREDIHVVVVGGETNGYLRIMGCTYQKTVSVDEWR